MSEPTLFVNLFGGPDAGKSTTAAGVFHLLKMNGVNAEYITEYAKDRVWHGDGHTLGQYQEYVHAKQLQRYARLEGKVQVAVSDAPPLLGLVYGRHMDFPEWAEYVYASYLRLWNLNIYLERPHDKPYNPAGRLQTEDAAKELDDVVLAMLASHVNFYRVEANRDAPMTILRYITRELRDDATCAAEPDGQVPAEHAGNSGSTPTAATNDSGPEKAVCIFCLKDPCECGKKFGGWPLADRLDFTPDEEEAEADEDPLPGIDVG